MTKSSSDMQFSPGARVRTLAAQMRELCLRLDELSGSIGQQAYEDEPDALVALLAEREPLVVELAGFGEELAAILDDPASARELGQDEHNQIRERLGQLEVVMGRIRERDRQARSALQRRRDQLAEQLSSVNVARGAARAYSGAGRPVNPTVQDSRG
ncbi:MAG: hypothetical protein AB8F26_02785 [Phycisphaerales bacterium]